MAPLRKTRTSDPQSLHDTDSADDTEQETPKPPRHGLKKRVSEVYALDHNDASFSSEGGRAPLRSVNINDDVAEKRRRRKSSKLFVMENAQAGPSSEGAQGEGVDASRATGQIKQKQQLNSVDATPAINVSLDVMNSNFEEWMKMATDNKINAANSWNFALIDYFHDMSLLRNNTDNSINFQRASCTLDGCVKIWSSRVDSVGTETGKLLSNLASEGKGDDEDEPTSDNPDAQDPTQTRKRKNHRPESTLAKSAAQLRSKKLDLDFTVDPLFKKTCADFDEGGAHGLLMNHLSLGVGSDGGLRVVFDASDSQARPAEDEEEEPQEPEDEVDLTYLRKEFLPDLDALEDKAISHSLAGFSFSKDVFSFDETTFFREDTRQDYDDDDENEPAPMDMDVDPAPVEDFFVGDQAVGDDFGSPDGGQDDYGENASVGAEGEHVQRGGRGGPLVPFDPRNVPSERDLVMAMTDADGEGGMLDYFDQNFLKNWAGPEHWKLRKVVRKPDNTEPAAPKAKREKKEAFKIDFSTPAEKDLKETAKELFAPATRGAGINLPGTSTGKPTKGGRGKKSKEKEKKDDHRLPDDMHFSSRQLVTLFLKPKFSLKMRGQRVKFNENGDGEVDENFWAQAAAEQAAGRAAGDDGDTPGFDGSGFDTGGFDDVYGDDNGDGMGEGGIGEPDVDAGEQDLLAATHGQSRRVRPEFVNYAKKAKRVDVRKLKENIWKGLDIKVPEEEDVMDTDEQLTDPTEAREFGNVISGLQKSYPREKMEEISTSFCFICLLHLANEQGLKLETQNQASQEMDEDGVENKVGNLWDLKIYRDPEAARAA